LRRSGWWPVAGLAAGAVAGWLWGWFGGGDYENTDSALGTSFLCALAGLLAGGIAASQSRRTARPVSMTIGTKRVLVAVLAVTAAVVGGWAAAFPLSFYSDFPSPGRGWVSALGPYNEHLVRDVGALYLALLVLSVAAWRRPTPEMLRTAGGAWLIFNAVHLLWHSLHLGVFAPADRIGNVLALGASLILSILLMLPERDAQPVNRAA
jgi:hypothetical protein